MDGLTELLRTLTPHERLVFFVRFLRLFAASDRRDKERRRAHQSMLAKRSPTGHIAMAEAKQSISEARQELRQLQVAMQKIWDRAVWLEEHPDDCGPETAERTWGTFRAREVRERHLLRRIRRTLGYEVADLRRLDAIILQERLRAAGGRIS